jgi:WD40 repeat protein
VWINYFLLTVLAWSVCFTAMAATPRGPVIALAFSPEGASLLASDHKEVAIRSTRDGMIQQRLVCDLSKVTALTFSPDGRVLAVAGGTPGESGGVHLFDWEKIKPTVAPANLAPTTLAPTLTIPGFDDLATSVAFSPNGTRLAISSADHSVQVFSIRSNSAKAVLEFTLADHSGSVLALGFTANGGMLVTASADRSIKVWDLSSGKLLRTFSNHTAIVHCLAFRPLEKRNDNSAPVYCATGSDDKTVRIWQPEIGRMVRIVRQHEGPILALAYSRDGAKLFSAGAEGIVRVIDADSDTIQQQWKAHDDWIYSLALSPDGKVLATGDWSGHVKLWDVQTEAARALW